LFKNWERSELLFRNCYRLNRIALVIGELIRVAARETIDHVHAFDQVDTAWRQNKYESSLLYADNKLAGPADFQLLLGAQINTYTANNSTSLPGAFLCNESAPLLDRDL